MKILTAKVVLENGMELEGQSFGYAGPVAGEVIFNTGMSGYPESFTDPSYLGQIFVSTFPLIGNYGIPKAGGLPHLPDHFESGSIQIAGLLVNNYSHYFSHWSGKESLGSWLKRNKIPALTGIDTRRLTRILRENGTMLGKIVFAEDIPFYDPNKENLVAKASTKEVREYGSGSKAIALIDCGAKYNIIRMLNKRGFRVKVYPWDYDFCDDSFDGLMISNGPGDPQLCGVTVEHIKKSLKWKIPTFGICLGHQLLARAAGAETYKLPYGHRGQNQPVRESGTDHCLVTSQNHGFAVKDSSLDSEWVTWFENLNDGTNEGIRHKQLPFMSVQFHPEANPGPQDAEHLFDLFAGEVKRFNRKGRGEGAKVSEQ